MKLLADPLSGGALRASDGLLRSRSGVWPVLGGVPILVPGVAEWLAGARDHVLAALAEAGRLEPEDLRRLDLFCSAVRGVPPTSPPDDFLADEEGPIATVPGEAEALVAGLLAHRSTLVERLVGLVREGPVVELGCGAGTLTRRVRGRPLVVVDRSLRAVLRATTGTDAQPVVGLAEALPLKDRTVGTLVAANVVDLLDDARAFVEEAARVLRPGGRLVLSTPDPALGLVSDGEEAIGELLASAGLRVLEEQDGVPWVRSHGPRHHQLYVCRVISAERPAAAAARRPASRGGRAGSS